jgi:hypothetical protein
MVAAGCMVLYGYDAAVFNAVQGNAHWKSWFNNPVGNSNESSHPQASSAFHLGSWLPDYQDHKLILDCTARTIVGFNQYLVLYWCYCCRLVLRRSYGKQITTSCIYNLISYTFYRQTTLAVDGVWG